MWKLLRYSTFSSNVSADALSITKQVHCSYIAIKSSHLTLITSKISKWFTFTSQYKMMLDQTKSTILSSKWRSKRIFGLCRRRALWRWIVWTNWNIISFHSKYFLGTKCFYIRNFKYLHWPIKLAHIWCIFLRITWDKWNQTSLSPLFIYGPMMKSAIYAHVL